MARVPPPFPQQTYMQHPMWKVNIKISQTRAKRGTTSLETTLQKPSAENGYRNGFHTNLISFFLSTLADSAILMYQYYRVYLYTVFPEEKCLPEILDIV